MNCEKRKLMQTTKHQWSSLATDKMLLLVYYKNMRKHKFYSVYSGFGFEGQDKPP